MAKILEAEGRLWLTARSVCEDLGRPPEQVRVHLIKSSIEHKLIKAPGRDGKRYKMLCVPASALAEFQKMATTYIRGPYYKERSQ